LTLRSNDPCVRPREEGNYENISSHGGSEEHHVEPAILVQSLNGEDERGGGLPLRLRSCSRAAVVVVLACLAFVGLDTSALASVSVGDVVATRAFLRASEVYVQGAYPQVAARVAAIEARESEVAEGCPSALTYAPRDTAFEEVGEELRTSEWYAGVVPMRSIMLRLADAIGHLRWSDRKLTRLVRAEAAEERADVALTLPGVCGQMAAWKASAYTALPSSVGKFLTHVEAIESGLIIGRQKNRAKRSSCACCGAMRTRTKGSSPSASNGSKRRRASVWWRA
jgi:hypothetical protein